MWDVLSPGSRSMLESLLRPDYDEGEARIRTDSPLASMAPTIVCIKDPITDIEAIVERLDDLKGRRPPHTWLQKQQGHALGATEGGVPTYEGRACCLSFVLEVGRMRHVKIGSEHTCPQCGAQFRMEMRARELRQNR